MQTLMQTSLGSNWCDHGLTAHAGHEQLLAVSAPSFASLKSASLAQPRSALARTYTAVLGPHVHNRARQACWTCYAICFTP